jgi:moderate conductance mechanosensitive channel
VNWVLRTAILIVAIMMSLDAIGLQIGPMIAAAGIVGLAIGFGAQSLVQDVISGFFILLEDQVRVGDVVQLNDKGGLVERITLRTIILRDLAGSVHYVRNGKIDIVTNMTKDYSRYVFDVGVAYRENVDEVIEVLKEIDAGLRADPDFKDDILQPIEILGLDRFADSALIIRARTTTKPIKQWRVGREFNRRLKMKFDELGIEIPFPHLTVYPGQDKKGGSPALRLTMEDSAPSAETANRRAPRRRPVPPKA